MSDKTLGAFIFLVSLVVAVAYVYWLFFPPPSESLRWLFYAPIDDLRWAVILPVLAGVMLIAFIALWIGWTMATTPPPTIMEEATEEEKEEEKKE